MLRRDDLKGIITIMPTAFKEDGSFDEVNYRKNINKICQTDVTGIMNMGTTGEFSNISWPEYKKIVDVLIEEVAGRIKVIVGASAVNTEEAIQRTYYAQEKGADAVINVVPFYQPLSQEEVVKYFKDLASECRDIGIIAYNNNITTKILISPQSYKRLSEIPNFCGSKEITTDIYFYMSLRKTAPELKFLPVEGLIVPSAMLGVDGFFSSIVFMNPKFQNELYNACKTKDWTRALELQYKIIDFINRIVVPLRKKYSETSLAKALVNASGFLYVGPPRAPYIPVSEEDQEKIRRDLERECPYLIYK
ncbi:MAG: dihydrodipicolinate synthase family protein [Candidatus Aenigmatarchaeota archaeon]